MVMQRFIETILILFGVATLIVTTIVVYVPTVQRSLISRGVSDNAQYYVSVVRLLSTPPKKNMPVAYATGWAVDANRLITAGHFCETVIKSIATGQATSDIRIQGANYDGSYYNIGIATIEKKADKHDLCVLYTKNHNLVVLPLAESTDVVETEDDIVVVGAPGHIFPIRRDGRVVAVSTDETYGPYQGLISLAIDVQGGSSGSPVIWRGQVIGVVIISSRGIHNLGLAENVRYVRELLDSLEEE